MNNNMLSKFFNGLFIPNQFNQNTKEEIIQGSSIRLVKEESPNSYSTLEKTDKKEDEDKNFLLHVIQEITNKMQTNIYSNGYAGTLKIAESYLKKNEGYSYNYIDDNTIEIFHHKEYIGNIKGQSSSVNKISGVRISNDKIQTEKLLEDKGLPTTKSILFKKDAYDFAKILIETKKEPVVVKPNKLSGGRGITLDVDEENFNHAWKFAVNACKEQNKNIEILVQEKLKGIESRFLVIDGNFNSAILRIPANIHGDGERTIEQLINQKNKERNKNPYLKRLPIIMDSHTALILDNQDLNYHSVIPENKIVFLRHSSNLTQGGDSIEISHLVSDNMKNLAEKSVSAIPGLNTAGVDILYTSFDDTDAKVLEINTGANLRMHHYPLKGKPRTPVYILIESMNAAQTQN